MKKPIIILMVLLCMAIPIGCAQTPGPSATGTEESGKIRIVATVFPIYDFARAVAGDQGELTLLVKPGAEVHSFEPSPADMITIGKADVFLYIGGERDVWVDTLLASTDVSNMKIVKLMDTVSSREEEVVEGMEVEEEDEEEVHYDEHIWTSPSNAVLMVNAIRDALCQIDSENAETYQANAEDYTEQIQEIGGEIKELVENGERKLLIFGDRFPFLYFVEEFGLTYRAAFSSCNTETEASAQTLAFLTDTIKNNGIPCVYHIELSNQNVAAALSEQTGAEMLLLHSCQNVTRDEFQAGATYVSLMRQNIENLRKGLF